MGTREIIIKSGGEIERLKREFQSLFTDSLNTEIRIMRKRLLVVLGTVIAFGLAPATALAEGCGDYPLTLAQSEYLQAEVPYVAIPTGSVPFVLRCDVDGNNVVDNNDLFAIRARRGQPPTEPDDPMDWDGNGIIHGRDVGGCASSCTSGGCAVKDVVEEEGLQEAKDMGQTELPGNPAACYQVEDFDGDGTQDFVGIYEYTGTETRGNNWALEVVILTGDPDDVTKIQHVRFQYSGKVTDGGTDLRQHLSLQQPGTIDLKPGSITINEPAVVSYRDGEPHTIYYFSNGILNRAFYGIDD
jgi:hypothetical protein